ncbi:DNA mismatch repair protein MutS [Pikeienuella piscinae]|uniref:DNA mismatch repair protein MutS n=1 Tax=Pikeienuella piscinae TaxID=2748098 RepID=A0A7L5BX41_9RHOB|nr:Smr/MutS family protein [Pikeienuella piscinae]QIE56302.1 DNA mismatch repair protein MutS [Pikeienuella piscinae]
MSRRRGRSPTTEELALWDEIAVSLRRRTKTAATPEPAPVKLKSASVNVIAKPVSAPTQAIALRPPGRAAPPFTLPAAPAPRPSGLDRATETRLRKGRRAPDARLDLHGMTAQRAHRALIGFVEQSSAAGRRCLLVITGKGGLNDAAPGVLHRETPFWLAAPPLADMIVNVTPAHPRHGGGGALYVYLKRRR